MSFRNNKDLKLILHPYIFVLKEGGHIKENFLDYSLSILQVSCPETIRSPDAVQTQSRAGGSEFDFIHASIAEAILKQTKAQ